MEARAALAGPGRTHLPFQAGIRQRLRQDSVRGVYGLKSLSLTNTGGERHKKRNKAKAETTSSGPPRTHQKICFSQYRGADGRVPALAKRNGAWSKPALFILAHTWGSILSLTWSPLRPCLSIRTLTTYLRTPSRSFPT